ncbi:TVP38/TMEM64 family inner membrane protein YdjZ [bioreactor metagenome]|uniref:TVP38/TMEM64 family inner membrane protein YdjZ n=1 Tax=bioreactor metagenome TaxID=1076179 RepID=A0A645B681_9ZZZZ
MAEPANTKICLLKLSVLFIAALAYFYCPGLKEFIEITANYLQSGNFDNMRQLILSYGIWAPLTSIGVMALQSLVPFVPGLILTIANAWIFGWVYGSLYSWLGSFIGAMIDFGIARWYGRPVAERLVKPKYLNIADSFFTKHGVMAVFITRLIPIVPFKVISYGSGLAAISASHFALVTAVGQIPAIIIYSILGQNLTKSLHTIVAVTSVLLGLGVLAFYCRDIIERHFFPSKD